MRVSLMCCVIYKYIMFNHRSKKDNFKKECNFIDSCPIRVSNSHSTAPNRLTKHACTYTTSPLTLPIL